MKKLATLVFVFAFLFGARSFAQTWVYQGVFPDTSFKGGTGVQFVTVDADGKVWIAPYTTPKADSMFVPDSAKYKTVRRVHVYNPDGTPWDTIRSVTIGGVLYPFYSTGYGITQDKDGNILYCNAGTLYKIDYKTGEGLNRLAPGIGSLAVPGVDAAGNIFVTPVLPNNPIKIYDNNFNFVQNAIDTMTNYGRWMTVSADGNTMYVPRYDKNNLSIYNRPDELSAFTLKDSVLQGIEIESGAWDPLVSSNLWLSAGNYAYNQPYGNFAGSEGTYYEFNTTTWQKVDSIKWQFNLPANPSERPRGIAFSKDGKTAYIAAFGSSDYSPVQKFTRSGVGVEKLGNTLPTAYLLDQNYPNPFNPETSIRFSIPSESFVTVKVFNTLGEEVTTLVNEQKTAGVYSVSFKANNITSGIYFYTINANNFTSTKKMILLR